MSNTTFPVSALFLSSKKFIENYTRSLTNNYKFACVLYMSKNSYRNTSQSTEVNKTNKNTFMIHLTLINPCKVSLRKPTSTTEPNLTNVEHNHIKHAFK